MNFENFGRFDFKASLREGIESGGECLFENKRAEAEEALKVMLAAQDFTDYAEGYAKLSQLIPREGAGQWDKILKIARSHGYNKAVEWISGFGFPSEIKGKIRQKFIQLADKSSAYEPDGPAEKQGAEGIPPKAEKVLDAAAALIDAGGGVAGKVEPRPKNPNGVYGWIDLQTEKPTSPPDVGHVGFFVQNNGNMVKVDLANEDEIKCASSFINIATAGSFDNKSLTQGRISGLTAYAISKTSDKPFCKYLHNRDKNQGGGRDGRDGEDGRDGGGDPPVKPPGPHVSCEDGFVWDGEKCVPEGGGKEVSGGPVPIFKNIKGKGAKEGGSSLQSVLQNWINKNGGDFDRKTLQQAVRQIVMDIAKQMKSNTIEIQEAVKIFENRLNLLVEKSNPEKEFAVDDIQGDSEEDGISDENIQALDSYLSKHRGAYNSLKEYIEGYEGGSFDDDDEAMEYGLEAYSQLEPEQLDEGKLAKGREAILSLLKKGKISDAAAEALIWLKKAQEQLQKIMKSHQKEEEAGQQQTAESLANHAGSYVKLYDVGKQVVDKYLEDPEEEEEEEEEEEREPEEISGDMVLDALKNRLRELDLDSETGRAKVANKFTNKKDKDGKPIESKDHSAYLGAYMFYRAMKKVLKALEKDPEMTTQKLTALIPKEIGGNEFGSGSPYAPKRTGPINEFAPPGDDDQIEFNDDIISWLKKTISVFEKAGLADSERAVKASKTARGVKEPKEKAHVVDPKAAAGSVNTRQIIAPRLKAAGINLDKNSPEGQKGLKFVKNLQKVIRRFIARHLKRLGKDDIKQITEKLETKIIAEILSSNIDFSNKRIISESIDNLITRNLKKELRLLNENKK